MENDVHSLKDMFLMWSGKAKKVNPDIDSNISTIQLKKRSLLTSSKKFYQEKSRKSKWEDFLSSTCTDLLKEKKMMITLETFQLKRSLSTTKNGRKIKWKSRTSLVKSLSKNAIFGSKTIWLTLMYLIYHIEQLPRTKRGNGKHQRLWGKFKDSL